MSSFSEAEISAKVYEEAGRGLLEYIKCIVCGEHSDSSAFVCENGHFTCSICQAKILVPNCQVCKQHVTVRKCFARLLKNSTYKLPCRNAKSGCKFTGT